MSPIASVFYNRFALIRDEGSTRTEMRSLLALGSAYLKLIVFPPVNQTLRDAEYCG